MKVMLRKVSLILVTMLVIFTIFMSIKGVVVFASPVKKIKIGVIGPLKFSAGEQLSWGARIAAEEINASGGLTVGGVKYEIELAMADSNEMRSVTEAVNAMEKLITIDKVNYVTGGYATESVMAMQEVIADNRTIYIGGAGSTELTERVAKNYDRYKYYFRGIHPNAICFINVSCSMVEMAVDKIRAELKIATPRVAFLIDKIKVAEPFVQTGNTVIPKMGAEIVGVWRTSPFASDLTAELTAIKASGAHIIYYFVPGPSGVIFSKQWGELRIPAVPAGWNNEMFFKRAWNNTNGMCEYESGYAGVGPAEITPKTVPFWNKFLEKTGEFPAYNSGTYDCIYILKEAIERARTIETQAVLSELEKTDYIGTTGRVAFYSRKDKWPHDMKVGPGYVTNIGLQWQNGKLVVVWPDGQHVLGNQEMIGLKYKGTVDYKLPPWMLEYWRGKK